MRIGSPESQSVPSLRVTLLGGFRVDRDDLTAPVSNWPRRSAKTLTKVLATCPGHTLHREQLLEILWPGADIDSSVNSLRKALHAARRAFQPTLLPRQRSTYLLVADSMVAFDQEHVHVDADHFEHVAHETLRRPEIDALEFALAAYRGHLLPEDRYADWCTERRDLLADLRARLLLELADLLERRGAYNDCANRLRAVLEQDPTREEVHRRLMRLYTEMGTPDQAVRQFHACEEVLQRELNFAPQEETIVTYEDVLAHRTPSHAASSKPTREGASAWRVISDRPPSREPFVGRAGILDELSRQLPGHAGRGGMVLLSGEAGIGKTRVLEEFSKTASDQGVIVLWGGAGAHGSDFACGPLAIALETYVAARPVSERRALARRYPALSVFIPSLVTEGRTPPHRATGDLDHLEVVPAIVRLLTDVALRQPVLLVLGDLCDADARSLDIIGYLAHLALDRRWLVVAAARDEELELDPPGGGADRGTAVARLVGASMRGGLCLRIELQCLTRAECYELATALLPGAAEGRRLLDQIYALSRGNPLFIRELIDDICAQGRPNAGHNGATTLSVGGRVPRRVRSLTEAHLASLDSTAQRILCLIAAADTAEISLADLRTGAAALDPPVGEGGLLDALDRALEIRLLEERTGGYAFRQPLVRRAVYERLSRHRRAQLGDALHRSYRAD
jgi:DNA-binding SARP family transcriptional activator